MAVEYRLVNDNGVQKVIKLDITKPNKKGMPADTTATIVNGDLRTILPLKGSTPISAEEVSIEEWAPTYPGSPTNTWKSSTKSFTDEEIPNLIHRVRNLLKSPNRLQTGGWLAKFDLGGTMQQPDPDAQKRMKELLLIINGAAKELSTKQPGDNVAYLAQVMQNPQEAALIEAIIAEIPDAQEVIDQVSQLSSQMFKCGGKAKKKVKKGAKGCVPCKKLLKVGGKLVNVWSDCEGNIISKHQIGGWIRKGYEGLKIGNTTIEGFSADHLLTLDQIKASQGVQNETTRYYYDPTDKFVKRIKYENGAWGNPENYTLEAGKTFGTGEGQINLWEDGYNLETGLMHGAQTKRTYKSGAVEMLNSRAETTDPVEFRSKADEGQSNAGYSMDPNRNVTLNYTVAEKARNLRNQRRADYWANRMAGNSIITSAKERRNQRRMDQNAVYGWHANQGADFFGQEEGFVPIGAQGNEGNSYKTFYNAHKNYTKNIAKVTTPSEGDVEISASAPNSTTTVPTKLIKAQQRYQQGGWLTKFQDGGHMDYETKSNISGTTWEQRIDRDNTGALYRYNPGRTSHVVTLQTTGLPTINPNRFVKYGEERYYLTDPKTGRVMKIEGPTIDQRIEEVVPIVNSSIIEDHITPEQDIFIFPGGFTKVIPTPVQKEVPKQSKKPTKPKKNIEGPKQEVPVQPNDNTSTSGSKTPGNIRQGNYPIYEPLPAPDGYDPSNEWVEEKDQVNGQVRVTWRNKKTGEISRIKPFKYGGWLTKFN